MKNKDLEKSQKVVSKAVTVFSKAVAEVEKANEILKKGIEADQAMVQNITKQLIDLECKVVEIQEAQKEKNLEIKSNEALIANFKQFI